jgi:hypothetical protein
MAPVRIGFKTAGTVSYVKDEEVPRQGDKNIFDTETIPRLTEYRDSIIQSDPFAATVLDSYIQLYTMGLIEVTFDEVTGEPVAEIIKNALPQFHISVPSATGERTKPQGAFDTIN